MIPDRSSEWQYLSDGVVSDPVSEERLRELVAKGGIPGNTPVRAGDAGEWQPYTWVFEDAVEAENIFNTLMGDKVEPRRLFIETHALDVQNLDI